MKKLAAFLISIIICFITLFGVKYYLGKIIESTYYDKASEILTEDRFKSLILQKIGIKRGDNLFMFGSSEFESARTYATHGYNFFDHKKDGFQLNLVGKAGYKCMVHAVDIGALGKELKGQKIVFVLSPQWFTKGGIDENTFEANSSELQVYSFLFNSSLSVKLKQTLANRILQISAEKSNKDFASMRDYCKLFSKDNIGYSAVRYVMSPYYYIRYQLLYIKNEMSSLKTLKDNKRNVKDLAVDELPGKANFDWNEELKKAEANGSKNPNNKYGMDSAAYISMVKDGVDKLKGSQKKNSYEVSPEYDDFKLLLDVCKEEGIDLMVINVPVNGKWYDFTQFDKNDRQDYYTKVNQMVKDYGFKMADFSKLEYEEYFLKDGSHLGWKGWVHVDEAIDNFYKQN